ncbi:MAG: hypothetical protein HY846_07135 [Nitrosomonadales bacterium]|nr:hypothetical protein [Nitrosomonadales bacterium]
MNGFAVFCTGSGGLGVTPGRVVPPGDNITCDYRAIGQTGSLLTWSHTSGDIHCAARQDSFLVLSGYVLESRPGPDFSSQDDAAEWCLARIDEKGSTEALAEWLAGLRGSFGIFYRNHTRNLTLCITDRAASRPLWRQWQQSGWIVSSHPAALALSMPSPRFDALALGSFLVYGGPVEPCRSLFQGVTGTPPGTIVSMGASGDCKEHCWYRFRHEPDPGLRLSGWVDLAAERLITAASRLVRSGEKMAVFFSGGTDSRLAAAALKAAGGNPLLVTLGDSENLEAKVARMAAKALGLPHQFVLRDDLWYLRTLNSTVYETGGNYVWIHGHFAAAAARVAKETGAGSFVLGDLCEAFSKLCCSVDRAGGSLWSPEEFAGAFDSLRLPLYRPANKEATLSLLNAKIRADVENGLRREITGLYKRICPASTDPLIVGDQCLRWDSVQTIPTYFMFLDVRSEASERNIMLDSDVHELFEKLPSRFRNEMNLGALLIQKLHPSAAWVMNSNSLLPMVFPPSAHKLARRIKPVLGKLRRSLFSNTYRTTGSWPMHSMLYSTNPEWRRSFEDTLGQADLFDPELFDRDAIRRCWQAFLLGEGDRAGDVEKLVQLGILSRMLDAGTSNLAGGAPGLAA